MFCLQTQKFQTVANGLSRWVDGMQGGMGHQERITARVRLIEVQIKGLKVRNLGTADIDIKKIHRPARI